MGIGTKRKTRTRMSTRTASPAPPASSPPESAPAPSQGAEEEEEEEENKEEEEDEKETGTSGAQVLVSTAPTRASPLAAALRLLHCGWAARVREALWSETRSRTRRGGVRTNVAHLSKVG